MTLCQSAMLAVFFVLSAVASLNPARANPSNHENSIRFLDTNESYILSPTKLDSGKEGDLFVAWKNSPDEDGQSSKVTPVILLKIMHNDDESNLSPLQKRLELLQKVSEALKSLDSDIVVPFKIRQIQRNGKKYFVQEMEFTAGQNLRKILFFVPDGNSRLANSIAEDTGDFLAEIFTAGLAHGDLKPENMIKSDVTEKFRVIDYGAMHFYEVSSRGMGSLQYLAPEYKFHQGIAGDLWARTLIIAEALLGENLVKQFFLERHGASGQTELAKLHRELYYDGMTQLKFTEFVEQKLSPFRQHNSNLTEEVKAGLSIDPEERVRRTANVSANAALGSVLRKKVDEGIKIPNSDCDAANQGR